MQRDAATHSAYAAVMLSRAVIGPEDVRHPEIAAFIQGFYLPCPGGFTIQKVLSFLSYESSTNYIFTSGDKNNQRRNARNMSPHMDNNDRQL